LFPRRCDWHASLPELIFAHQIKRAGVLFVSQGRYHHGDQKWRFESELEEEFEGEYEGEFEGEFEGELEGEYEGEEFFGRIRRAVSGFVRRAAPVLRRVAQVAAPIVGTAVGGPLGGMIGRAAASALREEEFEFEIEGEYEGEFEGEMEEEVAAPATHQEALAELMADVAARAQTEAEAEAMVGAATLATLSPADRATLRNILPHLVRGTAILTRLLRRRRITRPAVRTVPTIVRRATRTLRQRAASGQPITRRTAARAMATQTRRVLGSPRTCAAAIQRNVRATRAVRRTAATRPAPRQRQRPMAR
jgi:hypothetical protein